MDTLDLQEALDGFPTPQPAAAALSRQEELPWCQEWERGLDPGVGAVGVVPTLGLVVSYSQGHWVGCSVFLLSAPGQCPGPKIS